MSKETCNSSTGLFDDNDRFKALYEETRIIELQKEILHMAPKWLTKRPPGTTPAVFEYTSTTELSSTDCTTVEVCYNGIHAVLRDLEERTGAKIHYYYKATSRPTDEKAQFFAPDAPQTFLSILVDFSDEVTLDKALFRHILTSFYNVREVSTGNWCCKQLPPTENATLWRLNWFKRHVEGACWLFYLGSWRHRRFEFNDYTQKPCSDDEVDLLDEEKQKEQDRKDLLALMNDEDPWFREQLQNPRFAGLCDPYNLQQFQGKEYFGP